MLTVAMALIGVGCSPVLMASFYIFARTFTPAVFGTLGRGDDRGGVTGQYRGIAAADHGG